MLDCPLHTHTSPNTKPDSVRVALPEVAVRLCSSKLAGVAGRSTRHVVLAPVAWSGPTVAGRVTPPKLTSTVFVSLSQKPHTIACLGAAASTMPSPTTLAKRKAGSGASGSTSLRGGAQVSVVPPGVA